MEGTNYKQRLLEYKTQLLLAIGDNENTIRYLKKRNALDAEIIASEEKQLALHQSELERCEKSLCDLDAQVETVSPEY